MKIKEFQDILKKKNIDIALFYNLDFATVDSSMVYFSGYSDIGFLIIPQVKKAFIILPSMDYERFFSTEISKHKFIKKKKGSASIKKMLRSKKIRVKKFGVDYSRITVEFMKNLKKSFGKAQFVDIGKDVQKLRVRKTRKELQYLKTACSLTDSIIQKAIKGIKKKELNTEHDVAAFLEIETIKNGCTLSFPSIVASGSMASIPHYTPQDVKLRKGFCVIDFGVEYKRYKSDITRTIYIGKPNEKEKELYSLLLICQQTLIKELHIDQNCGKVFSRSLQLLGKYKKKFVHGLGHGIGINIHELPNLVPRSKDVLENGMVFTIEPGLYFDQKLGMRIEDDVAIVNNKVKVLTKTTKRLIVVN